MVLLFLGFFLVCFTLGYPALARYDPSEKGKGNTDSFWYRRMVNRGNVVPPFCYRVLTPALARGVLPVVSRCEIGGWDPALFALWIVNAAFTSLTALVVMRIAAIVADDLAVVALAPWVYLSSFVVVNHHLAGLIDSAEAFFLAAIFLALLRERWLPAAILVAVGPVAKETILPLGLSALAIWWATARLRGTRCTRPALVAVVVAAAGGSLALGVCRYGVPSYEGHVLSVPRLAAMFSHLGGCLFERTQVYAFAFLLPMAVPRLRRLPAALLATSAGMAVVVTLLGAYAGITGNLHRPLFCVLGPVLVVSSSIFLRDLARSLLNAQDL